MVRLLNAQVFDGAFVLYCSEGVQVVSRFDEDGEELAGVLCCCAKRGKRKRATSRDVAKMQASK